MLPPHARLENHLPYAENAIFSVEENGFSKRPGSECTLYLGSSLDDTSNYRLKDLAYSTNEVYVVLYGTTSGSTIVRICEPGGRSGLREAYVSISTDANTYLNTTATSLDRLRIGGSVDKAYLINTEATPAYAETTGSVNAATVANPTSLTTAVAHGLTTGDYVTFANSTGITPSIDGTYVVTVTGASTFTIPVNVTAIGGSQSATWYNAKWTATTMPVKLTKTNSASGPYTVTGITVAVNPVVTIGTHALVAGQTITLSGTDSTPSIDGTHTIASVGGTTVTINGLNTTIAGTAGTAYANAAFAVDVETWKQRQSGTPTSNPAPSFARASKKIRDLAVFEGRLSFAAGPYVQFSQANDLTDLWLADPTNIVESDPFAMTLGEGLADIDYLATVRRVLLAFGRNGIQYDIGTRGDAFTQAKATAPVLTRYATDGARPCVSDNLVYFTGVNDKAAQLREMTYDEVYRPSDAPDVSKHVRDLLFTTKVENGDMARVKSIVCDPQSGTVLILRTRFSTTSYRGSDLFRYNTYFGRDREVLQRAWTRLTYRDTASNENVMDVCAFGNSMYMLRGHSLGGTTYWFIEKSSILPVSNHNVTYSGTDVQYSAFLDCQESSTGTATTKTIIDATVAASTEIQTSASHGLLTGDRITISGSSGTTPSLDGTYTITKTAADKFTIPLTVSAASGETGTVTYTSWTFTTARPFNYALYRGDGTGLTLGTNNYTTFTAGGDYDGAVAVLGQGYLLDAVLPEPYAKNERGEVEMSDAVTIREVVVHVKDTIKFDLARASRHPTTDSRSGSETFTNTLGVGSFGLNEYKTQRALVLAESDDVLLRVQSPASYPWPVTVTGVQFECSLSTRPR